MQRAVLALPVMEQIELTLTLYPKNRQLTDIDNVCSVHAKYFGDALVELGKLPDDNYNHIIKTTFLFGSVCKEDPRVDIFIKDLTPMKITFTLSEALEIIRQSNEVFDGAQLVIEGLNDSTLEKSAAKVVVTDEVKPKRTRRSKAEIEAAKAETQPKEEPVIPVTESFEETNEDEEPIVIGQSLFGGEGESALIDEVLAEDDETEEFNETFSIAEPEDDGIIDLTKPLFG